MRVLRSTFATGLLLFLSSRLQAQQELPPLPPMPPLQQAPPRVDAAVMAGLQTRFARLVARFQSGQAPRDKTNFALLRFKIEQAAEWLQVLKDGGAPGEEQAVQGATSTLAQAEAIENIRGDASWQFARATPFHERAYLAPDGSAQPFWVYLPRNYSSRRRYPLVVFLHGYSPDISKINPWLPVEEMFASLTGRGYIVVVPYGRRNSDFVNVGEDDTRMVRSEVERLYSIAPDRVFLLGVSMGGSGAYTVGLHAPHEWAGVIPISARSDLNLWFKQPRASIAPWKQANYDADDPRRLAENALHLPLYIGHGTHDDLVPVENARLMAQDLRALNSPFVFREITDGDHYIYSSAPTYAPILDWMDRLKAPFPPRRVVYNSSSLAQHQAYWASIEAFQEYGKPARIEAEMKADTLEVKTQNVARFVLTPPQSLLARGPIRFVVNGQAQPRPLDITQSIRFELPDAKAQVPSALGMKSPLRCGPIKECYRAPFLLVYGTLKTDGVDAAQALRFAREWQAFADGFPRIKADREVLATDARDFNLILFGTRDSNSLLNFMGDKLPLELLPDGYRLGDKTVQAPNIGLQFCYPSPFDARRMIAVQSGQFWGAALPVNHKLDLLPDFIVYDNTFDQSDGTNRALEAGYFDNNWQFQNKSAPNEDALEVSSAAAHNLPAAEVRPSG